MPARLLLMLWQSIFITSQNIQEKNIGEKKKTTLADSIKLISEKLTLEPIQEMAKSSQKALKDAFNVIEKHTTDNRAIKELKEAFSNFF